MSKIARYQGNVRAFASDAQGMERTVFGGTNQADDLTSQITASFLRGWGIVGASEHPSLEDFNAAMYAMSQFIAYQHQMGVPEWHAEQEYHIGSICTHNGESYQSLQNANIGSQPPSAKWTPVLTSKNGLANLGFSEYIKGLIGQGDQWDAWRYLGLVDALNGKQQADATLTALAGLVNGADKLPYFSGVDQMASTDLTAFMRGLLGKADAATAKAHLGVGSAGGRNIGNGFSAGGSEVPDMTFFAGLKGDAGYQYFPNGMLLQWGTVTLKAAPSGTSTGTFPVAFPAAGQQIFVTHDNPLANVMAFGAASIIDPTQFRVNAIAINADTFTMAPGYSLTLRWFAIGS
ncbi:gp53-like domain-containing protein [Citrobacter portucalensis]|uniref:gp53-like domain-containing protein n=1 Tax=Citrobacter portucalensis TaxID=1639133 RepID=UPI001E2F3AF2|nr:carbohydrate-binding protein [Citrobacter portucalensis]